MSNPITPNHYEITTNGEELIDVNFLMEKYLTSTQLKLSITQSGYLTNIVEYILRADRKEGIKDIEKAINNAILLMISFYKSGQIKQEYIKNVIEKLEKEIDKELNTLPVKCETTPSTPFKDALCEYMEEYIENIKNLRKNIKTIWSKDANDK